MDKSFSPNCRFFNAAANFADTHSAGEVITHEALSNLAQKGGFVEVSGRSPHQIKSVRCANLCDLRVVVPLEHGELAGDIAVAGGCLILKNLLEKQGAAIRQELAPDA